MTAGLIFDYGGTLDTGGQHWGQALWHAYERHCVPVTEAEFREAYVHAERMLGRNPVIGSAFTFRQTLETKIRLQLDFLETRCEGVKKYEQILLDDLYEKTLAETAHSRKVLAAIRERGLPMVLVSNFYGNMSVVLREFGFEGLFLRIIESAVVGIRKPDPRIFLMGVEALGLKPEEVMVVGDSWDKDIIPAHEAGCQTVWLRDEGWNPHPLPVQKEEECRYCAVIDSLDELLEMIKTK